MLIKVAANKRQRIPKVWGWEDWIDNNSLYCGKILFIKADCYTSVHYHKIKQETLYLQSGRIIVSYIDNNNPPFIGCYNTTELFIGDALRIPPGLTHKLTAVEDSYIIEFSTEHREEDTVRCLQ